MTDCDSISDCLACITSVMHCFFILTGVGDVETWSCVDRVAGLSGVRMTVTEETREFCPTVSPTITSSNEIVTYLSFALAIFCVIGICVMAYWARSRRHAVTSPPPQTSQPPPVPPRNPQMLRDALVTISTFAQRRQDERQRSQDAFNRRNAEFQRELAERLEQVRIRREAAYPATPRNTPEPTHRQLIANPPQPNRQQSLAPSSRQPSQPPFVPSRSTTPAPASLESRAHSISRASTPIMRQSREPTPFSREATPELPGMNESPIGSPNRSEHVYDSPADTMYESIENSPENTLPEVPPSSPPRSRFGRLLKQTSFFKCKW